MLPVIAPDVFALRPDFRALSIVVKDIQNGSSSPVISTRLAAACRSPCAEPWAAAHLESWREAYRAFGAKPQRTPCSAEALLKRALRDGMVPSVNPVVDLYNAISLAFALPVGGEDMTAYAGVPHLVRATGAEVFDTLQNGVPAHEHPETGEVVWRDEAGVTCRRWNWRQGTRTRITPSSTHMWFVLEALDPMPQASLIAAGRCLVEGLQALSPEASASLHLLSPSACEAIAV